MPQGWLEAAEWIVGGQWSAVHGQWIFLVQLMPLFQLQILLISIILIIDTEGLGHQLNRLSSAFVPRIYF